MQCACNPNKKYASTSTFHQHKKSQKHLAWEAGCNSDRIDATRRDNEVFTQKLKNSQQAETIARLEREILKSGEVIDELMDKLKKAEKRYKNMILTFKTNRPPVVPDLISL